MIVSNSKEEQRRLNSRYGDVLSENLGKLATINSFNAQSKSELMIRQAASEGSENDLKYSSITGLFYGIDSAIIVFDTLWTFTQLESSI